ncbi:MAG: hypothetical protein QXM63_03870, partial [Metallosphaera sp.]
EQYMTMMTNNLRSLGSFSSILGLIISMTVGGKGFPGRHILKWGNGHHHMLGLLESVGLHGMIAVSPT